MHGANNGLRAPPPGHHSFHWIAVINSLSNRLLSAGRSGHGPVVTVHSPSIGVTGGRADTINNRDHPFYQHASTRSGCALGPGD